MSASTAPAPSFPCRELSLFASLPTAERANLSRVLAYTTSGCPLFNTIELPKPTTPSCSSQGCSPPAPSPLASNNDSLKLRPIGTPQPLSPGRLPSLDYASSFAPPRTTSALTGAASNEWNGYLDFGLQPTEVDLAPLYVPFPQAQPQPHTSTSTSTSKRSGSGAIWDLEDLVSGPSAKKPKVSSATTSPELLSAAPQQPQTSSGLSLPVDQSRASPASSEGGNEVVTVSFCLFLS